MIRILFFGDIFGRTGRSGVKKFLESKREIIKPDLVVANCDNAASGRGPTLGVYEELLESGIDILTCGDHIWDQKEASTILEGRSSKLVRPANYPEGCPGRGLIEVEVKNTKVAIISALGRVWTTEGLDSPFKVVDELIKKTSAKVIFVDLHAEASSEKYAFGHYFAGRVSAIIGSHTHVQTADETILDKKTAFISDAGFCGPSDSVIGVKKEQSIKRFTSGMPVVFEPGDGGPVVNGVVIDIDEKSGHAVGIERVSLVI